MDATPKTSICPDCFGFGLDPNRRSMWPKYQALHERRCTVCEGTGRVSIPPLSVPTTPATGPSSA
jgi:DnaJ-class molecular chaperone